MHLVLLNEINDVLSCTSKLFANLAMILLINAKTAFCSQIQLEQLNNSFITYDNFLPKVNNIRQFINKMENLITVMLVL